MIKYIFFPIYKCNVFIKNLNLDLKIVKESMSRLPALFYSKIDKIIIHDDQSLTIKKLDSSYRNDCIEINSLSCLTIRHLLKLLIHELYHSIEDDIKENYHELYDSVIDEFLFKKHKILNMISNDPRFVKPNSEFYSLIEYDYNFDQYLLNTIGYHILMNKIIDIVPSPYSLTSISEYIAVAVEIIFFENKDWLINYCPEVSKMIINFLGVKNGK